MMKAGERQEMGKREGDSTEAVEYPTVKRS